MPIGIRNKSSNQMWILQGLLSMGPKRTKSLKVFVIQNQEYDLLKTKNWLIVWILAPLVQIFEVTIHFADTWDLCWWIIVWQIWDGPWRWKNPSLCLDFVSLACGPHGEYKYSLRQSKLVCNLCSTRRSGCTVAEIAVQWLQWYSLWATFRGQSEWDVSDRYSSSMKLNN